MADEEVQTEQQYRDEVMPKANEVKTLAGLATFITELQAKKHDYGTIVVAMAAAMKATMSVMDAGPSGGITGFQASCVAWELLPALTLMDMNAGAKIIAFADLLYPQYDSKFDTRIGAECAKRLTEMAKKKIDEEKKTGGDIHPDVYKRWKDVSKGKFPDFVTVTDER